jgi:hypothetical protein
VARLVKGAAAVEPQWLVEAETAGRSDLSSALRGEL